MLQCHTVVNSNYASIICNNLVKSMCIEFKNSGKNKEMKSERRVECTVSSSVNPVTIKVEEAQSF